MTTGLLDSRLQKVESISPVAPLYHHANNSNDVAQDATLQGVSSREACPDALLRHPVGGILYLLCRVCTG